MEINNDLSPTRLTNLNKKLHSTPYDIIKTKLFNWSRVY